MEAFPNQGANQKVKVLIISDEPETAQVWGFALSQIGHEVRLIHVNDPVIETFEEGYPDLIVIEDFNDQAEELEICRKLRALSVVPILYLTGKGNENFQLETYQAGADECIPYPITPRLFQAKVKAWLRRTRNLPMTALDEVAAGGFRLQPSQKLVTAPSGEITRLSTLETRLLFLLMSHPGQIFQSSEIVERVWGYSGNADRNLVKNQVYRLRRKIEPDPAHPHHLINTGPYGYKFSVKES